MIIIQKEEFETHKSEIIKAIKNGALIIYPTDTIYGIGCDATNEDSVLALRNLKERGDDKPFSIIAPNKEWILNHCIVPEGKNLEILPGPYTLIFKPLNNKVLAKKVDEVDDLIRVRIPDHFFSKIVNEAGIPIITTSVNISGTKHMETLEELPEKFKTEVAYLIYEGEKKGVRSKLIDLTN